MKKVISAVVDDGEYMEVHAHWPCRSPAASPGERRVIVSWATSRRCSPACSTSTPRRRRRASCAPATPSTSPRHLRDVPGFMRAPTRSTRDHPPRRQAPLRLLRVDGAAHPDHHPEGLRRRLRRHELEVHRGDLAFAWPSAELASWAERGGRDRLPARAGRGRRPVARRAELVDEYTERYANPTSPPSGLCRRRDQPGRHAQGPGRSLEMLATKHESCPVASTERAAVSEAESAALAKRPSRTRSPRRHRGLPRCHAARTVVVEEAAPEPRPGGSAALVAQPLAMRRSRPGRH